MAMTFYAIGIRRLLQLIRGNENENNVKHAAFAIDMECAGKIAQIKNPSKSWLIVKNEHLHDAIRTFADTTVKITTFGHKCGKIEAKTEYVNVIIAK